MTEPGVPEAVPPRDTPVFGMLLTPAVLGSGALPALARSRRVIADASRRFFGGFRHRYGYLVPRLRR